MSGGRVMRMSAAMLGVFFSSMGVGIIGLQYLMGHAQDWYPQVLALNLFLIGVHGARVIKEA